MNCHNVRHPFAIGVLFNEHMQPIAGLCYLLWNRSSEKILHLHTQIAQRETVSQLHNFLSSDFSRVFLFRAQERDISA